MIDVLLLLLALLAAVLALVVRSLVADEARGRLARRLEGDLERTISALPIDLQDEWGDEWRAELAALQKMPLTAMSFVRGVARTAGGLVADLQPAGAEGGVLRSGDDSVGSAGASAWISRLRRRVQQIERHPAPRRKDRRRSWKAEARLRRHALAPMSKELRVRSERVLGAPQTTSLVMGVASGVAVIVELAALPLLVSVPFIVVAWIVILVQAFRVMRR